MTVIGDVSNGCNKQAKSLLPAGDEETHDGIAVFALLFAKLNLIRVQVSITPGITVEKKIKLLHGILLQLKLPP